MSRLVLSECQDQQDVIVATRAAQHPRQLSSNSGIGDRGGAVFVDHTATAAGEGCAWVVRSGHRPQTDLASSGLLDCVDEVSP